MAAIAVLAVAFAVFAAIPAVDAEDDAAKGSGSEGAGTSTVATVSTFEELEKANQDSKITSIIIKGSITITSDLVFEKDVMVGLDGLKPGYLYADGATVTFNNIAGSAFNSQLMMTDGSQIVVKGTINLLQIGGLNKIGAGGDPNATLWVMSSSNTAKNDLVLSQNGGIVTAEGTIAVGVVQQGLIEVPVGKTLTILESYWVNVGENGAYTLVVNGKLDAKVPLELSGDLLGSGTISGDVTVSGTVATYGLNTIFGKVTVGKGSTLIIPAGKSLAFTTNGSIQGTEKANSKLFLYASVATADASKVIEDNLTVIKNASAPQNASSVANAAALLNGGAKDVTITATTVDRDITVPADSKLTLPVAVTISAGKTLQVDGDLAGAKTIILNKNGNEASQVILNNANGFDGTFNGPGGASVLLKGVSGDIVIKSGSLNVDVSGITGGEYEVTTDNVYFYGNLNNDLKITVNGADKKAILKDLNINSGAKLTLVQTSGSFEVKGKVSVYGSIYSKEVISLVVPKDNTLTAYAGASISNVNVTGAGKIDLSLAQKDFEIGQDISSNKDFGQLENVVVIGTLTIGNNAIVTVAGGFQINEGVTLTIESGATLKIESDVAAVNIAGNIIIEDGAHFIVEKSKSVTVSGTVESDGEVLVKSNVTIKSGGKILINEGETEENATGVVIKYNSTIEVTGGLTVEADAVLEVHSQMKIKGIENKGTVTFAGAVLADDSEITLAASNASVVINSVSGNKTLTITDEKLKFTSTLDVNGTYAKANEIKVTPGANSAVSGLTVVETVKTSVNATGTTVYKNYMDLSGSIVVSAVDSSSAASPVAVAVTGQRITVEGKLDLGNGVTFTVGNVSATEKSVLTVSGTIIGALKSTGTTTAAEAKIENAGIITVTGLIQVQGAIGGAGTINAAMYETTTGTTKVANYTTLKAAIESGAKMITVTGIVDVTESLTVPKDVTIKASGATINVGSTEKTEADRAVVLTFADGAIANGGTYKVIGTLVFENKKNDKAEKISDVAVIDEKSSKYTNIYTAINGAKAGEVISIYSDRVVLDASLTIPADVTVDVPSGKILSLDKGVTLTVVGTLKTASKLETETGVSFATKASTKTGEYAAAIVVSGKLMSQVAFGYSDYKISGAYFQLTDTAGDYCYVTPIEYAATVADKVVNNTVEIWGTVTAGDVAFTGTSTVTVHVKGMTGSTITVASITLTAADLDFNGKSFTGTVKVGDAAVAATKITVLKVNVKDGSEDRLLVENVKFDNTVDKFETAAFSVSAGTVSVKAVDSAAIGSLTVAQGATLMSSQTEFAVPAGVIVFVDGVITVDNGQTISVEKAEVAGTITVAKETDTKAKGTFSAKNMYVGITAKDVTGTAITGAAAVLSGNVVLGDAPAFAVVAAGSDVDADAVKALGKTITVYSVEGKDWITVYAKGNVAINAIKTAPVTNAQFNNWVDEKGVAIAKNNNTTYVGSKNCAKVAADVKYDIYKVHITPCAGVESIAIDGNLIGKGL